MNARLPVAWTLSCSATIWLLLQENTPAALPIAGYEAVFDDFAPTFDTRLRALGYDAPQRLAAMLQSRTVAALDILDLGCGTGQCGLALVQRKGHLVGVDLSEKMLVQARAHGIYDELHLGEIYAWLCGAATARFDAVIAADVFVYIGALEALFREVARVLRTGGWLAFTTEECEVADYTLLPTGRYAHSQSYIVRLAEAAFAIIDASFGDYPQRVRHAAPGTALRATKEVIS